MTIVLPDGTEKHRLEELSQKTAHDIRECANCCDVYSKKKTLYKVLAGKQWEKNLARFGGTFSARKQEFLFALTIHTAVGIDVVGKSLADSAQKQEAEAQMIAIMNNK